MLHSSCCQCLQILAVQVVVDVVKIQVLVGPEVEAAMLHLVVVLLGAVVGLEVVVQLMHCNCMIKCMKRMRLFRKVVGAVLVFPMPVAIRTSMLLWRHAL